MDPQLRMQLLTNSFVLLFVTTLRVSAPLIFAALGGVFCERSGVVNVGLEGIMLMGAFAGMAGSYFTGVGWWGFLFAAVVGLAFALIHAVSAIQFRGHQVVSGMALNVLAMALTGFLLRRLFEHAGHSQAVAQLPDWRLPLVDRIPVLGRIIGQGTPPIYLALLFVFLAQYVLFHTPLGLRIRAVGEHPEAAESLGVNVNAVRYLCVGLSGVLGGLGGATMSVGLLNSFGENMTAGRGYIALAAVIFGKWRPLGAWGACLLFGLLVAFQVQAQTFSSLSSFFPWMAVFKYIPRELFLGLPYLVTILILAGLIGRSTAPAASGVPYEARK